MYTITILFALLLSSVLCDNETPEQYARCLKLDMKIEDCCKMESLVGSLSKFKDTLITARKECTGATECDRAICIAKKFGHVTEDGKVMKAKAIELIEEEFGSQKDIITAVKEKCINGDVSSYGPPDLCELVKYQRCWSVQVLGRCDKWDTEGDCAGAKQIVDDCFKMHS